MCAFSAPRETPAPRFDSVADAVKVAVDVSFGSRSWALPPQLVTFDELSSVDDDTHAKWFGRLLLDGGVFPDMKRAKAWLVVSPASITVRGASGTLAPRVALLVGAIKKRRCWSVRALRGEWVKDPCFLREHAARWVRADQKPAFLELWSAVVRSSVANIET